MGAPEKISPLRGADGSVVGRGSGHLEWGIRTEMTELTELTELNGSVVAVIVARFSGSISGPVVAEWAPPDG